MAKQIQYIGARYVVKIYENKTDPSSAEWDENVNYEPLTMVTYNNGSYLSRKDVPASVGNPAENPTYWAQTGFYNGQIAALQNAVRAINAELEEESRTRANNDATLQRNITALNNVVTNSVHTLELEDSALDAKIEAEKTARADADGILSTSIGTVNRLLSDEVENRADAIDNLQNQIDEIIAPSGEAPSAAEVENARIGADGVTYNTLGNAIRGQVGGIYDFLDFIVHDIVNDNVSDEDLFSSFTNNSSDGITYTGGVLTVPAGEYAVFFHREYGDYVTQNITFKSDDYVGNEARFRVIAGSTATPGRADTDVAATLVNNEDSYFGELAESSFASPNVYFKFVVDNRTGASSIVVSEIKASLGLYVPFAHDLTSLINEVDTISEYLYDVDFLNPSDGYVRWQNGTIGSDEAYNYSKVGIVKGCVIKYKTQVNESIAGLAIYDIDGNYLTGLQAQATEQTITAPSGSAYMLVSFRPAHLGNTYVKVTNKVSTIMTLVESVMEQGNDDTPKFICGSSDVAIVGHEWNCFFDGIVKGYNPSKYSVVATVSPSISAKLFERCLRITPVISDVGTFTITLTLVSKKTNAVVDSTEITLKVIADSTLSGKKVMFIGDSLTNNGTYPAEIEFILSNEGVVSVGTRQSTVELGGLSYTVHHEGRSGWAAYDYTRSVPNYKTDVPNPFWDGSKFDFEYYMDNSGISKPDVVCIALGTNGRVDGVDDVATIVNSIHAYDADMPVLVTLLSPPAYQDGCGYHTGLQSASKLKNELLATNVEYIDEYDSNASRSYTDVVNLSFALDREYDYDTAEVAASARNPKLIEIQTNNVHPSTYGFLHFADSFYGKLLDILG